MIDQMIRGQSRARLSPIHKIKLAFMAAAFLSLVLSVTLWFTGSKDQGIFVGLWVPAIHSLGALLVAGERFDDQEDRAR